MVDNSEVATKGVLDYTTRHSNLYRNTTFIEVVAIFRLAMTPATMQQDIGRLSGTIVGDQDIAFDAMKS